VRIRSLRRRSTSEKVALVNSRKRSSAGIALARGARCGVGAGFELGNGELVGAIRRRMPGRPSAGRASVPHRRNPYSCAGVGRGSGPAEPRNPGPGRSVRESRPCTGGPRAGRGFAAAWPTGYRVWASSSPVRCARSMSASAHAWRSSSQARNSFMSAARAAGIFLSDALASSRRAKTVVVQVIQ